MIRRVTTLTVIIILSVSLFIPVYQSDYQTSSESDYQSNDMNLNEEENTTDYTLTIYPVNGTITVEFNNNSYDIDYERSFSIEEGTEVNLTADFMNVADWTVNDELYAEGEKSINIVMDEDKDVVAESTRSTRESLVIFYSLFISLVIISIIARIYIYFTT